VEYSGTSSGWKFEDPYQARGPLLFRNAVFHNGEHFEVVSFSLRAGVGEDCQLSSVLISRNVGGFGDNCFEFCSDVEIVAFEGDSHLRGLGRQTFSWCTSLKCIAIPSFVDVLGEECFSLCTSLRSLIFELPSRLATIERWALCDCESLTSVVIPASVTTIYSEAFQSSGISWIEIEEGSISFRVVNDLLVDFEGGSMVWVIGSPESILIPSSIEELGPSCCAWKARLRTVEFESTPILRSIGESAFVGCGSLESICIPSSVEVLHEQCFSGCWRLRTVRFESESKLRVIERMAFARCPLVKLVSVPASAEVVRG
jgi:hypothetical protein